jgi:hypothetical protein
MAEQVGTLLWSLRTARGWSLGQLAERAGVSKSALSRWETGKRQPFIPELEGHPERAGSACRPARACTGLHRSAPRSAPPERAIGFGPTRPAARFGRPAARPADAERLYSGTGCPTGGSTAAYYRALGVRRPNAFAGGDTDALFRTSASAQEMLCNAFVSEGHWAAGHSAKKFISSHNMSCAKALGAKEQELIALTTGDFSSSPEEIPTDEGAVVACLEKLLLARGPDKNLTELHFLALERALWRRAVKSEAAQRLLAFACAFHAHYLSNEIRWQEAHTLATRTLELTPRQETEPDYVLRGVLQQAAALVHNPRRPSPERGIYLLQSTLSRCTLPDYRGWILADMAKYAALAGETERGVALAQEAVRVTNGEIEMRLIDYCRLLIANGQYEEALRRLPALTEEYREVFVYAQLIKTEALLGIGERNTAQQELHRTSAYIEAYDLKLHRQKADALAKRLANVE